MIALTNIRDSIPRWVYISFSITGFIIPLAVWQIICSVHVFSALFLPSPERVFKSFERWTASNLWEDTYISAYRVVSGFLLAATIGVPTGIYIGTFKMVEPRAASSWHEKYMLAATLSR